MADHNDDVGGHGARLEKALTDAEKEDFAVPSKARRFTSNIIKHIAHSIGIVAGETVRMNRRVDALSKRLAELEAEPKLKYMRVWERNKSYFEGQLVTHDGSLWHCNRATTRETPGQTNDAWTLAVKRGRDGKR